MDKEEKIKWKEKFREAYNTELKKRANNCHITDLEEMILEHGKIKAFVYEVFKQLLED